MDYKIQRVSVPLEELATGRGVIANLVKRGAAIQESQAKLVSQFIMDFFTHNKKNLPAQTTSKYLGVCDGGIITPLKSIGTDTQYTGDVNAVGDDYQAYPDAIKEVVSWGEPAWPLLFTLSMSLISPFIKRLNFTRNPTIAFIGQSNSGKTTAALFSTAVWGDSERIPFKVDGSGKTTKVGIEQNSALLRGLPWLLDEIHKMRKNELETSIYEWGNGEGRVYGSPDGTAKGGQALHGTLFLCGEDLPQVEHKGSTNRVLIIDVAKTPPLGVINKVKNNKGQL